MALTLRVLEEEECLEALEIHGSDVKIRWKSSWLAEPVPVVLDGKSVQLSAKDSVAKIDIPGKAVCL